ncbi:MAG: hypothetical protein GY803_31835 [Chloroflexi bacterium]|nr:hypothetical protein [Chloroflexota bacterium]
MTIPDTLQTFGYYMLGVMGVSLILALLLLIVVLRQARKIDVPPDASFQEALLYTPFSVVLLIDLLDLGLDFLSIPFTWIILDKLGLKALRGVSVVEAAVPFTQPIPTMTLAWIGARILK